MRSPHLPPRQWRRPSNWSGAVESQCTLHGFIHWLCCQCLLPLLMTLTWVTSTIAYTHQTYGRDWYRVEDGLYPPPLPQSSFYHSYLSLFLYPITQFILSINLYLSLLSLAISPIIHLIFYCLSSPFPKINLGLLFHCPRVIVGGGWGFDNDNISNSHENTDRANLTPIHFICSLLSLMKDYNPWVWSLPLFSGSLFTPLPSYFLPIYI